MADLFTTVTEVFGPYLPTADGDRLINSQGEVEGHVNYGKGNRASAAVESKLETLREEEELIKKGPVKKSGNAWLPMDRVKGDEL